MESTDSSPALSMTDTEKKGDVVTTVTDGNGSSATEYERFLHLKNVFSRASRKKLLRKCMTSATIKCRFPNFRLSGPTPAANAEFSILDVLAG